MIEIVRTHLEMPHRDALRPARSPGDGILIERWHPISAHEYRLLYDEVGGPWHWRDRLRWSDEELDAMLSSPEVHVWTLRVGDETAGFFELQRHTADHVEIMYFGLVRRFIGRGLGGWMLTCAVEKAFGLGASRVTLHTCSLDAPQALPNYLARGFSIVREERYDAEVSA